MSITLHDVVSSKVKDGSGFISGYFTAEVSSEGRLHPVIYDISPDMAEKDKRENIWKTESSHHKLLLLWSNKSIARGVIKFYAIELVLNMLFLIKLA